MRGCIVQVAAQPMHHQVPKEMELERLPWRIDSFTNTLDGVSSGFSLLTLYDAYRRAALLSTLAAKAKIRNHSVLRAKTCTWGAALLAIGGHEMSCDITWKHHWRLYNIPCQHS